MEKMTLRGVADPDKQQNHWWLKLGNPDTKHIHMHMLTHTRLHTSVIKEVGIVIYRRKTVEGMC